MAAPLLTLQNIGLTFGSKPLLEGAELLVGEGERICLVGRNGSGKSTLLKIAAGLVEADYGERFVKPGTTLRYLPQEPDFSGYDTVLDYVEAGLTEGDYHHRGQFLLDELGLDGAQSPLSLSGGEARRAALARALAPEPDILMLDEPTNHLDLPVIEWLEKELKSLRSAMVLISHDRRFLENLSRATVWLDRGQVRRLGQGFSAFEAWRDQIYDEEQREQHKLDRQIVREEHWLRYGVTARRKRNVRRLGQLQDLREKRRTTNRAQGSVTLRAGQADSSGKLVIEAKGISKAYDGRMIISPFDMRIARGDRIGIVGPNGAGKTTLINMLTGRLAPDAGTVKLGTNLEMISLDQRRESLDPDWTLREAMTGNNGDQVMVNGEARHVMSYMKDFLFTPEQARTPIGVLSGGERGRLMLARALARDSNIMVLDEPTNDLDLETLDMLQEMLADYGGTVLLVSHDRDFIDRVVSGVLNFDGDGKWVEYAGGYSDMLSQKRQQNTPEMAGAGKAKSAHVPTLEPQPATKRKMTFKDKHALETLPQQIADLQNFCRELESQLSDAGFYGRDAQGFEKVTAQLSTAQDDIAAMEERWLELEVLRESLQD